MIEIIEIMTLNLIANTFNLRSKTQTTFEFERFKLLWADGKSGHGQKTKKFWKIYYRKITTYPIRLRPLKMVVWFIPKA